MHAGSRETSPRGRGSVYGGPIGGTDIRNAYVPPTSGLYIGLADVPGYATQYNGNNGGKSTTVRRVNFTYDAAAVSLAYVYPVRPLGLTLSSSVQVGYLPYERFSVTRPNASLAGSISTVTS